LGTSIFRRFLGKAKFIRLIESILTLLAAQNRPRRQHCIILLYFIDSVQRFDRGRRARRVRAATQRLGLGVQDALVAVAAGQGRLVEKRPPNRHSLGQRRHLSSDGLEATHVASAGVARQRRRRRKLHVQAEQRSPRSSVRSRYSRQIF
jgi:hypothetical protein